MERKNMTPVNIVVLAAGKGQRMHSQIPKVLHLLTEKPLLAWVLDAAKTVQQHTASSSARIILVLGAEAAQIQNIVDCQDCAIVMQAEPLGTGDALVRALPLINPAYPTLVLLGDVPLIQADTLLNLIKLCTQSRSGLTKTLGILSAVIDDPKGYGRIVRNEQKQVLCIVEQKEATVAQQQIKEINTGIMLLPSAFLDAALKTLSAHNTQHEYYLTDIIEHAIAYNIEIVTMHPKENWEVVGVNDQIQRAQLERIVHQNRAQQLMQQGLALADPTRIEVRGALTCGQDVFIDIGCVFEGQVIVGDRVKIGPYCVIRNTQIEQDAQIQAFSHIDGAEIGARARVGPYARLRPETQLAHDVQIGNFVEVKKSQIGSYSKANHLSYLGDTHIAAQVNIGAGVITCNYDGKNKHSTQIDEGAFIGSDSQLIAPLHIAQNTVVAAGTSVWRNTRSHTLVYNQKQQMEKDVN